VSDRIILKWIVPPDGLTAMMQPGPVVAVAWQRDEVTVWIDHDREARRVERSFVAVPTGVPFPAGGFHVGSAVSDYLVFHVYELTQP
jgi:hypothetical protein